MARLGLTVRRLILCVVLPYLFPSTPQIYTVIVRLQLPFSPIPTEFLAQSIRHEPRYASAPAVIIRAPEPRRDPQL
jgi:hypothetical protein